MYIKKKGKLPSLRLIGFEYVNSLCCNVINVHPRLFSAK